MGSRASHRSSAGLHKRPRHVHATSLCSLSVNRRDAVARFKHQPTFKKFRSLVVTPVLQKNAHVAWHIRATRAKCTDTSRRIVVGTAAATVVQPAWEAHAWFGRQRGIRNGNAQPASATFLRRLVLLEQITKLVPRVWR